MMTTFSRRLLPAACAGLVLVGLEVGCGEPDEDPLPLTPDVSLPQRVKEDAGVESTRVDPQDEEPVPCEGDDGCDPSRETSRCTSTTSSERCVQDGACFRWKAAPCETGTFCTGTRCLPFCSGADGCDATTLGALRCAGDAPGARQTCSQRPDGCFEWIEATACPATLSCVAGACACTGCRSGDACLEGTSKSACGAAFTVCRDCDVECAAKGKTAAACFERKCLCVSGS